MKASVTLQDVALVQTQGGTVGATVEYPGFSNRRNAERAAQRDLRALATPLLSCTVYCGQEAADLDIGDTFKLEWPDYHEGAIIMRVTGMAFGDGRTDRIRIDCVEDVFGQPEAAILSDDRGSLWTNPTAPPGNIDEIPADSELVAATTQIAEELPYRLLVNAVGPRQIDAYMTETPDVGILATSAARPTSGVQDGVYYGNAINALIHVDAGSGYVQSGTAGFCGFARLVNDIEFLTTDLLVNKAQDLSVVEIGSFAQIDDELVRVDAVETTSEGVVVTVGRGILDTVPTRHLAGASILFWQNAAGSNGVEYEAGESINVKLQPRNNSGTAPLASAIPMPLEFDSRAIRPYPPGNVKINGIAYPDEAFLPSETITITWAHRDRLQQTGATFEDTTVGNIGPEPNTIYRLEVTDDSNNVVFADESGSTTTIITGLNADSIGIGSFVCGVFIDGNTFYIEEYISTIQEWRIRKNDNFELPAQGWQWVTLSSSDIPRMQQYTSNGNVRAWPVGQNQFIKHGGNVYAMRIFGRGTHPGAPFAPNLPEDFYTHYTVSRLDDDSNNYDTDAVPTNEVVASFAEGTKFYLIDSSNTVWSKDIAGATGVNEPWVNEGLFEIEGEESSSDLVGFTERSWVDIKKINSFYYMLLADEHVVSNQNIVGSNSGIYRADNILGPWVLCPGTNRFLTQENPLPAPWAPETSSQQFAVDQPLTFAGNEDEIIVMTSALLWPPPQASYIGELISTDGFNFTEFKPSVIYSFSGSFRPLRDLIAAEIQDPQGELKKVFAGVFGPFSLYSYRYMVKVDGEWRFFQRSAWDQNTVPQLTAANDKFIYMGGGGDDPHGGANTNQVISLSGTAQALGDTEITLPSLPEGEYTVKLWSNRDGYASWQQHVIPVLREDPGSSSGV